MCSSTNANDYAADIDLSIVFTVEGFKNLFVHFNIYQTKGTVL